MSVFAVMSCGTSANRYSLQAKGLVDLFSLGGQDTRRGFSLDACLFPFIVVSVNRNYLPLWFPVYYKLALFFDIIIYVFKFLTEWDFVVAMFLCSQISAITLVSCLNHFFLSMAWLWMTASAGPPLTYIMYFATYALSVLCWSVTILMIPEYHQVKNYPLHFIYDLQKNMLIW